LQRDAHRLRRVCDGLRRLSVAIAALHLAIGLVEELSSRAAHFAEGGSHVATVAADEVLAAAVAAHPGHLSAHSRAAESAAAERLHAHPAAAHSAAAETRASHAAEAGAAETATPESTAAKPTAPKPPLPMPPEPKPLLPKPLLPKADMPLPPNRL